jgi:hypothetical protein
MCYNIFSQFIPRGAVAQLEERLVRNQEVRGSIPLSSTMILKNLSTIILKVHPKGVDFFFSEQQKVISC